MIIPSSDSPVDPQPGAGAGDAVHAGTVRCPVGGPDVILAREVTAEAVAAGAETETRTWTVARLGRGRRPHRALDGVPLPPWGMRLVRLVREATGRSPGVTLNLDWCDDGERCWLVDRPGGSTGSD